MSDIATIDQGKPPDRSIFGFPLPWAIVMLVMAALFAWMCWLTVEVREARQRKIVSVSLATILGDFVQAESARNQSDEAMALRTKQYLAGVEKAMTGLSDNYVVLLSEAVAGNSVPDVTPEVMHAVQSELDGGTAIGSVAK